MQLDGKQFKCDTIQPRRATFTSKQPKTKKQGAPNRLTTLPLKK